MLNAYMNEQDVPSAKEAEAFVTVGEQRYNLLNAKNFEGKANISTKEIPVLGKIISGRKPTGMVVQAKMTVYKCSEMFDRIVTEYKIPVICRCLNCRQQTMMRLPAWGAVQRFITTA